MKTRFSFLMGVCMFCLHSQSALAEIVGTLRYPRLEQFQGKAEVVMQNVRTGEIIAKNVANKDGHFSLQGNPKPLYTIVAKTTAKGDEAVKFVGEYSFWGYRGGDVVVNMVPKEHAISFIGRVVSPEGNPMSECIVSVDPGGYGLPEYGKWPVYIAFTDSAGRWKVDRIRPPAKWAVKKFLENPKMIGQPPLVDESLVAGILVKGGMDYKRFASLSIPLITENMRHKLGDIANHTTVQLPVSTNNVIYIGDIVLPEKLASKKND